MADISQEISAFQNAVYGEEVRSSMISLCEKVNDEQETVTSQFEGLKEEIETDYNYVVDNMPTIQQATTKADEAAESARKAKQSEDNAQYYAEQASQVVGIGVATTTSIGLVKPDGASITVDADGTIHGVGSAGILPQLYVTTESDSAITVTRGATVLTPVEQSAGHWYTALPSFGVWTISAVNSLGTVTYDLDVDTCKIYDITVTHFTATITPIYPSGATCTVTKGSTVYTATASGSAISVHDSGNWIVKASYDAQTYQEQTVAIISDGQTETVTLNNFATINVEYDSGTIGKTITLSKDSKTYTKVATSSLLSTFIVSDFGTWNIAVQGSSTTTLSVQSAGTYNVFIGGDRFINVTVASDFVGKTITCTNGSATQSKVASTTSVQFCFAEDGTFEISGVVEGTTYSISVVVSGAGTYTANLQTTITLNLTVYSASSDTVYYYEGNDTSTSPITLCTTDTSGKAENVSLTVLPNTSITFYSTVAKDTTSGTSAYSKAITLTSGMTELKVMPDSAIYWYGYNSGFEKIGSASYGSAITLETSDVYLKADATHSGIASKTEWLYFKKTGVSVGSYTKMKFNFGNTITNVSIVSASSAHITFYTKAWNTSSDEFNARIGVDGIAEKTITEQLNQEYGASVNGRLYAVWLEQ